MICDLNLINKFQWFGILKDFILFDLQFKFERRDFTFDAPDIGNK